MISVQDLLKTREIVGGKNDGDSITKLGNFPLLEKLGEGAHCEVWETTGNCAIKIYNSSTPRLFKHEITTLLKICANCKDNRMESNNITELIGAGVDLFMEEDELVLRPYVLMPKYHTHLGRYLASMEEQLPAKIAIDMCRQLIQAVKFLHSIDIIHTDIKPSNILVRLDEHVKIFITDFNVTALNGVSPTHTIGTVYYHAPELFCATSQNNNGISRAMDIWSACAVMYEIMEMGSLFNYENMFSGDVERVSDNSDYSSGSFYLQNYKYACAMYRLLGPPPPEFLEMEGANLIYTAGGKPKADRDIKIVGMDDEFDESTPSKLKKIIIDGLRYLPNERPTANEIMEGLLRID